MSDSQVARLQGDPPNTEITPFDVSNTSEIRRIEQIINENEGSAANVINDPEQNKLIEAKKENPSNCNV